MELWIVGWMVSKDTQINENYTTVAVFDSYEEALKDFNEKVEELREMYEGYPIEEDENSDGEKVASIDTDYSYDVLCLKKGRIGGSIYIGDSL